MATKEETKSVLKPWLEERGFLSKTHKILFARDNDFYLTFVELTPMRDLGFQMKIAVSFLWTEHDAITYDYYSKYPYAFGQADPNKTMGGIFYDSPTFWDEIELMQQNADRRFQEYKELHDLSTLEYRLTYCYRFGMDDPAWVERKKADHIHLAVVKKLLGKDAEAIELYEKYREKHPLSKHSFDLSADQETFKAQLLEVINNRRDYYTKRLKVPFPPLKDFSCFDQ